MIFIRDRNIMKVLRATSFLIERAKPSFIGSLTHPAKRGGPMATLKLMRAKLTLKTGASFVGWGGVACII